MKNSFWFLSSKANFLPPKSRQFEFLKRAIRSASITEGRMRRVVSKLQNSEKEFLVRALNEWRKLAKLDLIKKNKDPLIAVEIQNLARLRSLQLADSMFASSSKAEKRLWALKTLKDEELLKNCEKKDLLDECLDRLFGLNERKIKSTFLGIKIPEIYEREDTYLDSPPEDLFTPYRILMDVIAQLKIKPNTRVVDLGSGLGRVGIVLGLLHPKVKFMGLELMEERHRQAELAVSQLGLQRRIQFKQCDLSKIQLPLGDIYYLFNPFSRRTLRRVFQELYKVSEKESFRLLMAQVGRPPRMVKKEPWLKLSFASPLYKSWRGHGFAIYRVRGK